MTDLFLQVVNLSYSALWIVAAVVLLRVVLRKAPRWLHVLLWALVGLRLVLPFSVESSLSLQPSAKVIRPAVMKSGAPEIHTGIAALNYMVNDNINYVNQSRDWLQILAVIWLVGLMGMLVYAAVSYGRLKRRLRPLNLFSEGVFTCENLSFSFILGVFKPSVYVPNTVSEAEMTYILAHEQAHIRRKDHIWKPFGFVLLAIHWFNPALWLAYILLCRDIELACDEKVIRELGSDQRADYSQTILNCGISRRRIAACPLAFGGAPVKTRIRHILNYKKPAFWVILLAVLALCTAAVCLLTVPWESGQLIMDGYIFQQVEYKEQLPNGSKEIGRVLDAPDAEIRGENLPKKYLGLPVYRHESYPRKLYIPTSKGFLCFYSAQWEGEPESAQIWVDYLDDPGNMKESETYLLEFPEVTFRYAPGAVTAERNGEVSELFVGMPIWNVFFTDLNGDGYSEICATVSFGSGIIDEHVVVMDYWDGQLYTLWERGNYDYTLRMVDGVLICDQWVYPQKELVKSGPLTMINSSFMPWSLWIADVAMEHSDAKLKGIFDNFLFLEGENGLTYRYERAGAYGETLTQGVLLDSFTERAAPKNVQWEIYAFQEIPARTSVMAVADGVWRFRYDYSPARAASPDALEQAKAEGYAVMQDGEPTFGQELWQEFYEKSQRGEPASIQIARWYTLDPKRCDAAYYEANKEDYPAIYYEEIRFDGKFYQVLDWQDNRSYIPTYEYLLRFETEVGTQYSKDEPQTVIRYVLTHDANVRWEDLFHGMISSAMGAYIEHDSVWVETP